METLPFEVILPQIFCQSNGNEMETDAGSEVVAVIL